MEKKVLVITEGAGFLERNLCDKFLILGWRGNTRLGIVGFYSRGFTKNN